MRILSIRLPNELDHQLQRVAHEMQTTRSELARQVIADYLKSLAPAIKEHPPEAVRPPSDAVPVVPVLEMPAPAKPRKPRASAKKL